jgi:uncharacterized membrane protein
MFSKVKDFFTHKDRDLRDNRWIFTTILVAAIISLIAAFILSVEAFEIAKNPNAQFGCSINIIVNCATVAKSSYATMLGFPNSFIGLMMEPAFIVIAIAGLAGVKFHKLFMFIAQIIFTGALLFAYYLFFISTYIIQALCPWCLLVMLAAIVMFFSITRFNIREDNLYLSRSLSTRGKDFIRKDYDKFILALIFVITVIIIIVKYGNGLFA